ncbi:hypothetical protein HQ590_01735, partial [bacterium]|nr:hypothetical protein [bacterium]
MTKRQPSIHPLYEYRGTVRGCGRQYGASQAEAIEAFLHLEVTPDPKRLRYAARCWDRLRRWDRAVADFVRGMAAGSGLSVQHLTLLLLHEEILHTKPCTGVGATGPGTRDGAPVIAQNWDWNSPLYAWPTLTRLHARGLPRTFLYSYPGLWACAGINEHGMSLVWTGAGYLPKIKPIVGVPTYAIIPAILAQRTCAEALALLRRTPIAGSFIFFLADATGELWVVEAVPDRFEAVRCADVIARANHYECDAIVRRAKQDIQSNPKANT